MNPSVSLHPEVVNRDEIIVLGFDGSFGKCLINYTGIEKGFQVREFENSFMAFQWLRRESVTHPDNLSVRAVICEYSSMEEEGFLLLQNLRNHASLRFLPLIAMNRDGLNHKLQALQLGFDDYYDVPVHWKVLKERIDFLTEFKKEIDTLELKEQEGLSFKLNPVKRAFDVLFASIAILLLSPVFLLIGLLITIESRGSVIYRSKRVGAGYHVFNFLKFRSMYVDADQRLKDMEQLNQYHDSENGGLFKKFNNDPRVTKVGKLIRKTSLDELPQLFNILKGDMSIVGNRPLPMYEAELLTRDHWARRFLAPAGLTGLWQVSKRGKVDMSTEERINLDITYAENHSLWFDLKIILKTPFAIIQEENV